MFPSTHTSFKFSTSSFAYWSKKARIHTVKKESQETYEIINFSKYNLKVYYILGILGKNLILIEIFLIQQSYSCVCGVAAMKCNYIQIKISKLK